METLTFSSLSLPTLRRWVHLKEEGMANYEWLQVETIELDPEELRDLQRLKVRLVNSQVLLMNEATIWARGIYPLLSLAEQGRIQAWSNVPLYAQYAQFELEGITDGMLAKCVSGVMEAPYLVVVEAKGGLEAANPVYQLYGQLLAAAHLNWENDQSEIQTMFGCYTVADAWTFVRAEVTGITLDNPSLRVESSRQYTEQYEAETIVKILKGIVAKGCQVE